MTHRPCNGLIPVTGIGIRRTHHVWLRRSVSVRDTTASPNLILGKVSLEPPSCVRPGRLHHVFVRLVPSTHDCTLVTQTPEQGCPSLENLQMQQNP